MNTMEEYDTKPNIVINYKEYLILMAFVYVIGLVIGHIITIYIL